MQRRGYTGGLLLLIGLASISLPTIASDFLSVAGASAVLYDQPLVSANKLVLASRYTPLEVVIGKGDWIKVREPFGKLAWVQKSDVSTQRYVMVTTDRAAVHKTADDQSEVVFKVERNVVLELQGSRYGWVQVRHPDGASGYTRVGDVWGE